MTAFAKLRLEHMRLTILRLLETSGVEANEAILRAALSDLGHRSVSLRGEIEWLAGQGLVEIRDIAGVAVAKLTEHGSAVAAGADVVTGVARLRPGDR